ncbi:L-lactate permease [Nibrella saemangeumensis]|uniref:L-lactate permease n=1 Tax=Nibrella saemangeumensis TaxID=1084526 RepID=A0ABP8MYQ5_9BACT
MNSPILYSLLALLPLLVLIVLSLWKSLTLAVSVSFIVTAALFFVWQAPVSYFLASLITALLSTVTILMIVVGAIFLYRVMEGTGYINAISTSMQQIHPAREVSFFLVAIGLTAFFEGVAGFGTPGTIVPLLLMAMGFDAILALSVVLLLNSLVGIAGAVGTPVLTGLQLPLDLPPAMVSAIYRHASIIISVAGLVLLLFILRLYRRQAGDLKYTKQVFLMYAFFVGPLILFSFFAGEFSVILAAVAMLILSALVLKQGDQPLPLKPWLPYLTLIALLLLPKLIAPLKNMINWEWELHNLLSTSIDATFKPLVVPLIPFVVVGLGVMWTKRSREFYLNSILKKVGSVFIILYPAIAISQLMVNSGTDRPSMVDHLAMMLQQTGPLYVLFAPLLGIVGAFITGSTTVSNLVFGAAQLQTAQNLGLNESLILSLQLCGGSLGNGICLFNIIAAASVANVSDYKQILKNNLPPAIAAGLVAGIAGWLLMQTGSLPPE